MEIPEIHFNPQQTDPFVISLNFQLDETTGNKFSVYRLLKYSSGLMLTYDTVDISYRLKWISGKTDFK